MAFGSHVMHVQEENGGAGVYSADLRKHYILENPSWKRDIMPEIIEGKNVLDYVDPEIEAKLEALEMEEEALAAAAAIEVCLLVNVAHRGVELLFQHCCCARANSLPLAAAPSQMPIMSSQQPGPACVRSAST